MVATKNRALAFVGMLLALLPAPCLAASAEAAYALSERVAQLFARGGSFLYMNCFVLAWGLFVIVERFVFIYMRYNVNAEPFMAQIQKLVMANDLERAIKLCNAAPAAALPKVIRAGLATADRGEAQIRSAIAEVTLKIVPGLLRRTPDLTAIAYLATLIGLLGTISGLILALSGVGGVSPDLRAKVLGEGIAEALFSTAFGLTIAVICKGGHLVLGNMSQKILDEIAHHAVRLRNILQARDQPTKP